MLSDDDKVNLYNVARKRDQAIVVDSLSIIQPLITGFTKIIIMPFEHCIMTERLKSARPQRIWSRTEVYTHSLPEVASSPIVHSSTTTHTLYL